MKEVGNWRETNVLADEVLIDIHVLANEVNGSNNIAIRTFLHSLTLACLLPLFLVNFTSSTIFRINAKEFRYLVTLS